MIKKNIIVPSYLNEFKCIGGDCEDTCCCGWKVLIDEATYKKYKKVNHYEIKKKLQKNIIKQRSNSNQHNFAKMKMYEGKCGFLLKDGLCDIHKTLGEEYLCNTCAIYPRHLNKIDNVYEESLDISCPEVARIILLNSMPIQFYQEEKIITLRDTPVYSINTRSNDYTSYIFEIRTAIIKLLQSTLYNLEEKLFILGILIEKLEENIARNEMGLITKTIKKIERNIRQGIYKDCLKTLPTKGDLRINLLKTIIEVKCQDNIISSNYIECLEEIIKGLDLENENIEKVINKYDQGYQKYYLTFIEKYGYVMENYIVNYIFSYIVPFDEKDLFTSYTKLIVYFSMIKTHLVGIGNSRKELDLNMVIKLMYSFARVFEHDIVFSKELLTQMKELGYINLPYVTALLNS